MTDTPIQTSQDVGSIGGTGWKDDPVIIDPIQVSNMETPETNTSQQSWYARNADWLNPLLGGILGISTGGIGTAIIGALGGLATTYLQNKYNKEAYEQQKTDSLAAEQRANAEYDRRVDEANKYNEGWAQRLMKLGINPLSYITKGQAGAIASSTPSSPSSSIVPMAPPRQAPNISGLLEIARAFTDMKHTQAQTNLINSQTQAQSNQNQSYWEQFRMSMNIAASNLRNSEATARINEATASFKEATLAGDVEKASYELKTAFHEMRRSGISVDVARVELQKTANVVAMQALESQLMSQSIVLNGQQIRLNDLSYQDLVLTFNQHKHLVDVETQHKIDMMNETLRAAQKANNWYAFDKVIDGLGTVGSTVASVVNAFKPFPQVLSTTTTVEGLDEDGAWSTFSSTTRRNTYTR